jgi:hypothetical protein
VDATVRTSIRPFARVAYPIIALTFALIAFVGKTEAASRSAILEAIHNLENPRNSTKPGRHGELGAYQFRASTWRMYTSLPFSHALNRDTSDAIAIKHLEWIKRGLEAAHVPATPYYIALAWNSGLSATISGRSPRVAHDYALRASNLVSAIEVDRSQLLASLDLNNVSIGAQ